jgi:hypothetical protein
MLTILSFLGGNAFRLIFGEVVAFFTRKQEHETEMARMRLQGDLDAAQHARNLEAIRVQAEQGVKVIEAQRDADADRADAGAFLAAVESVGHTTGIGWLDAWNGSIRPALATLAAALIVFEAFRNGFVLSEWDRELVGAILGIYVADRHLSKRGK